MFINGQCGYVALRVVGESGGDFELGGVVGIDEDLFGGGDGEFGEMRDGGRIGWRAVGDPSAEDLIFLRIAREAQAAFVGDGGGGLEENQALVGIDGIGAAGEGVASEGEVVLVGGLAAEG